LGNVCGSARRAFIRHPHFEGLGVHALKGPAEKQDEDDREQKAEKECAAVSNELLVAGHKHGPERLQSLILFPVNLRKTSSSELWRTDSSDNVDDLFEANVSSPDIEEGILLV